MHAHGVQGDPQDHVTVKCVCVCMDECVSASPLQSVSAKSCDASTCAYLCIGVSVQEGPSNSLSSAPYSGPLG